MRASRLITACAVSTSLIAAPAAGAAEPAPSPTTSAVVPVPGQVKVAVQGVGGRPLFALAGRRVIVRASVTPYVAGQTLELGLYLDGRQVAMKAVSVRPASNGAGQVRASLSSRYAGLAQVRVTHAATAQQVGFDARSVSFRYVHTNLGPGAHDQSVRLLQSELNELHYAVPLTGVFDEGTGLALVAYRKMTGLARIPYAGRQVFELLARHVGSFRVRYRGDGRHVEANLTKQVLAEIEPGGRVYKIYTTSSGKPSTPTVIGRFQVYEKTPGENSEGMVDSNYFIRGYAIHGYAEVPTYAASHGCLRVPISDAPTIYGWVRTGTPVDVYNQDGGGSARVSANAGP
ncbi:MAG TPA: L,D-transpeptidase [Solirubrobacteraceae bacterium]|jgi:peptidoglycan hydrolase-like protein with peptidoglycan-binding domain|nr:L,D-transpeptidase [Solirubrobacteraceae bacterium]